MQLSPTEEQFVLHWGEMGTRWGVNRTVAQIHALLYLSSRSLNAEEIAETLGVARSNVSTSLKELQSWGLIKVAPVLGDRRDHFESLKDLWQIFFAVAEGRKHRELDPTLTVLRNCVLQADEDKEMSEQAKQKIEEITEFLQTLMSWYEQMRRLPQDSLIRVLKMGAKVEKFLRS